MSGIINEIAKQCARHHIALTVQLLEEDFVKTGNLSVLLVEALDDTDESEMDAAIDKAMGAIDGLEAALPKTEEWKAIVEELVNQWAEADGWDAVYDEGADPKARASAAADLTKSMQDVMGEVSAVVQCVETVKSELEKVKVKDGSKTIGDLAKSAEGGEGDEFPTMEDIAGAVEKSYVIPGWFNDAWETGSKEAEKEAGSFFDKVMGFLSGLFGGDDSGNLIEDSAITDAVLSSPFEEFIAVNLQSIQQELTGAAEEIGTETGEAAAGAAAAQAGQDSAADDKVDLTAANKGVEALKSDADTAKAAAAAVKGSLEPEDFAAFQTALDGKLDALAKRQQDMMAKILALYASGPDGANPETVADVAEKAEEAADEEGEQAFSKMDALADLGDQHFGDGGKTFVKTALIMPDVKSLFAAGHSPFGKKIHENSIASLLFEEEEGIPLGDVVKAFQDVASVYTGGNPSIDDETVGAWAAAANEQDLLDKKIAIASKEGEEGEEAEGAAPASEKEAEEEQALAQAELESAAQSAAQEEVPPAVAVATALDNWAAGLSKSSQQSLTAKKRLGGLKDLINTALQDAAQAIEGEVAAAIDLWRGEHEETLMKSKRFAQKNFDSLSELIPQIAAQMLKVTAENNKKLTRGMIRKSVHSYLNRKFGRNAMLVESTRWEVLAGVRRK